MDSKLEEVIIYETELEDSDSSVVSSNGTINPDASKIEQMASKNQLLPYQTQYPRRMKKITGPQGIMLRQQRRLKRKKRVLACMNAISEESDGNTYEYQHSPARPGAPEHSFDDIAISEKQMHYEDSDEEEDPQSVSTFRHRFSKLKSKTKEAITRNIYAV